ncbi:hypothetical protein ZRA01_24400 [Zoogloea ramigera]|mgnify:CR=1 FL=1|jgi:hypothetical protein|uniref:Uncharacterized protein n=1 Tax=Zoogloea ramigera TaxID=350 RepID=A0A4Y4CZA4_ZOORA|nr:hypothetical protein ZRA01_24400 [Zoogloea ramigera]
MANRTLGTRQKLVFRGPDKGPGKAGSLSRPRNPLVAPALLRKAGAHEKTVGAMRQASKRELARQLEKPAGGEGAKKPG